MFHCPALWFERNAINTHDKDRCSPDLWNAKQILEFTFHRRIDDAFAKPLYVTTSMANTQAPQHENNDPDDPMMTSDSEASIMDVSSLTDSSSMSDHCTDSEISVDSE